MPRRQIHLLADDVEYLDNAFSNWESLSAGNWILIPCYRLPVGYNVEHVELAIQLPSNYPVTPPDMAYFYPAIQRCDGKLIPATDATVQIDGRTFQRWSRHYKPGTWHPDEDSIAIHVMAIQDWLDRALQ